VARNGISIHLRSKGGVGSIVLWSVGRRGNRRGALFVGRIGVLDLQRLRWGMGSIALGSVSGRQRVMQGRSVLFAVKNWTRRWVARMGSIAVMSVLVSLFGLVVVLYVLIVGRSLRGNLIS